jgi:hypothetical protein
MTKPECIKLMAYLKAMYPRQEIADATVAGYADALRDVAMEDVMTAAQQHVRRSAFFPAVAELLALIGGMPPKCSGCGQRTRAFVQSSRMCIDCWLRPAGPRIGQSTVRALLRGVLAGRDE